MPVSTKHIKQVYKAIKMFHPSVLEDIKPKLISPVPVLIHAILLPALLTKFCQLKGVAEKEVVGIWKGRESMQLKTLFIAVIINLYNPELLTGIYSESMRDGVSCRIIRIITNTKRFYKSDSK